MIRHNNSINLFPKWIKYVALLMGVIMLFPFIGLMYQLLKGSDTFDKATIVWESLSSSIVNTVVIALVTAIFALLVGITTAIAVNKTKFKYAKIVNVLLLIPLVIPRYIGVILLFDIFGAGGGIIPLPFMKYGSNFAAGFTMGLLLFPYVHLFVSQTLLRLPRNIDESALLLNDSKVKYFKEIILKTIMPAIISAIIVIVIYIFNDFGSMQLMNVKTISVEIYIQYQIYFNLSNASVLALIPIGMTVILTMIDIRWIKKGVVVYNTKSGGNFKWAQKKILYVVIGLIILVTVILPLSNVIWLAIQAIPHNGFNSDLIVAGLNSLMVAVIAAFIAIMIAFIFSWIRNKEHGWIKRIYPISYMSYATSGIVLGIMWLIFTLNFAKPLYGTILIPIVALAFKYLVHGSKAIDPAIKNTTNSTLEASTMLGKGPTSTFYNIGVKGNYLAILSGFTLIMINVLTDLNLMLLLKPIGFETLSTIIWNAKTNAIYDYAVGPAALILIIFSLLTLILDGGKRYGK